MRPYIYIIAYFDIFVNGARDWTRTSTRMAYAPKAYVSTNSTTRA